MGCNTSQVLPSPCRKMKVLECSQNHTSSACSEAPVAAREHSPNTSSEIKSSSTSQQDIFWERNSKWEESWPRRSIATSRRVNWSLLTWSCSWSIRALQLTAIAGNCSTASPQTSCHQTSIGEQDLTRLVAYAVFVRIVQTQIYPSCCGHIDQVNEDAVEDTTETALMHAYLIAFIKPKSQWLLISLERMTLK